MIKYGLHFLTAAFIILVIILHHYLQRRHTENVNSRIFKFFICVGFLDILFDMLSTVLISGDFPQYYEISLVVLTAFYIMQISMPCAMVLYVVSLRETERTSLRKNYISGLIPAVIMAFIVLCNVFSGILFGFDDNGYYHRGTWYLLTYIYAVVYGVIALVSSVLHRKELSQRSFIVIVEYIVIEVLCAAVQAVTGLLTTGLGIALGIMIMYLTVNNPERYTDHLTGAFDRLYLRKWLREHAAAGQVGVLVVNLYQIDKIQRTLGTGTGEMVLRVAANKLKEKATMGRVFRTRDDQFIIPTTSREEHEKLRDQLRDYFSQPIDAGGEMLSSPVIICGIQDVRELLEDDMLAAYIGYILSVTDAKDETVVVSSDETTMDGFNYERIVERYVNTAVEENLMDVWFQPIYSMKEKRITAVEALSRLSHPTLGDISPDLFISIAERNGRIVQLGLQQLRKICEFLKANPVMIEKLENVKVNLSPAEILAPNHTKQMVETIREYGLPLDFFQFEITETVATEYSRQLYSIINEFVAQGINLCLDDFGSGYANLNAVMKLPFYAIKLDRSMLDGILYDSQIASFYRRIVEVLHTLGYSVIAEGVEDQVELNLLEKWGVDMIQGYYISRPVPQQTILKKI